MKQQSQIRAAVPSNRRMERVPGAPRAESAGTGGGNITQRHMHRGLNVEQNRLLAYASTPASLVPAMSARSLSLPALADQPTDTLKLATRERYRFITASFITIVYLVLLGVCLSLSTG